MSPSGSITNPIQGSLFEEDYLVRTLGSLARIPDVALTELVANAWDAGASRVSITIPDEHDEELIVEDDGAGMTVDQFKQRWMTLGYNRTRHQGHLVEFPPERQGAKRQAYGHNGVGRHGMLCFGDRYLVETSRDGVGARFRVAAVSGPDPFVLERQEPLKRKQPGTTLRVKVQRHLPYADRIRGVLASRFLYDPEFEILVNGTSVPLHQITGLVERRDLQVTDDLIAEAICVDAPETAKTTQQHGVAFWVGGRLVGDPSWVVNRRSLLDGRTRAAKRLTIIVRTDDIVDEVLPDWSGFRESEMVSRLYEVVSEYVLDVTRRVMAEQLEETRDAVLSAHRPALEKLQPLGRLEVREFVEEIARANPTIAPEMLAAAVQAVINLEETRSGRSLLEKLAQLGADDVDGLNKLLERWTVRDAMTVLDEIERRISLVEALEKLVSDPKVDELKTLHPLLTQARWLFGPEFESSQYVSNTTIRKAVLDVFKQAVPAEQFVNPKNRPDLVFLPNSTISAVGIEEFEQGAPLVRMRQLLIIELKKGKSKISRDEVQQAWGYVEDFIGSSHLVGSPSISAFVVGHEVDPRIQTPLRVGEPQRGRIDVCTFDSLTRTANYRLFSLRDRVAERYEGMSGVALSDHLHTNQLTLFGKNPP